MTTSQRTLAEIVAGLLALVGGYLAWRTHERALGAATAATAAERARGDSLAKVTVHDSVVLVQHDTVRVFRTVAHTDTVLQTLIDQHHDTVLVTREVLVEAKAALDSTKKVADSCCRLAHDYKAQWALSDSLNRTLLKQIPSPAKPWIDRGEGVLACFGAIWGASKIK